MTEAIALYLLVGTVAAVDSGWEHRTELAADPWWADAAGFAAVALLWFPVAAMVVADELWRRRRR